MKSPQSKAENTPKAGASPLAVIVLAAGKGTRMKSDLAKVLHPLSGKPMLWHVIQAVKPLEPEHIVVVTGYQAETVETALKAEAVTFARQAEQQGTGHATLQAQPALDGFTGDVLIVCGDVPLVQTKALAGLLGTHRHEGNTVTVASAIVENPFGLGRILRTGKAFTAIREQKDCTPEQAAIREVNTGIYAVAAPALFKLLARIQPNNAQAEYYLTDIVTEALADHLRVEAAAVPQAAAELSGVNTPEQLADAQRILSSRTGQSSAT